MDHHRQGVVLFENFHSLMVFKGDLERLGVRVRAVPTPRHLSSDCGSALLFPLASEAGVREAARRGNVDIKGIHELDP